MPVKKITPEEREQLFGDGVIIIGGHVPRPAKGSHVSAQPDSGDAASGDDERCESPKSYDDKLPLGNKND
jgi:hypothetical protein